MCPVVTHMNPVRDTNSEPGLPVERLSMTLHFKFQVCKPALEGFK